MGIGGRLPSGDPRGRGYLLYHFSGRDFGAKIKKTPKKFKKISPLRGENVFFGEDWFYLVLVRSDREGERGKHVLTVTLIGAREELASARQQPVLHL